MPMIDTKTMGCRSLPLAHHLLLSMASFSIIPSTFLVEAFTASTTTSSWRTAIHRPSASSALHSTPFDLDMYDNFNNDNDNEDKDLDASTNPFQPSDETTQDDQYNLPLSPLAVPPSTKLVLGINKYSHDTTLCAANSQTGEVLFALSKERISRKKHDGGNVATLVELCLDELNLDIDSISKVVMNNHHHRIALVESSVENMEWEEGLGMNGGIEDGYSDDYNLLESVEHKLELSHHLAHAYSAASQAPFEDGLIVVMDGMGETWRTMKRGLEEEDGTYVSDLTMCADSDDGGDGDIQFVPSDIEERAKTSYFDWREAESVYTFSKEDGKKLNIKPIFKRFSEENTPPTLYNHGFENMDSLGAVYSRSSSHIFGDWNACGKVMGLAPWQGHVWDNDDDSSSSSSSESSPKLTSKTIDEPILEGKLYINEKDGDGLQINKSRMMGLPYIARIDPDMFDNEGNMIRTKKYDFDDNDYVPPPSQGSTDNDNSEGNAAETETPSAKKQLPTKVALDAISLASRIQTDLETVGMDFVKHFKEQTGETNLCLAGGVGLNSVLNGRLSRELGFEQTFIPPYPGDDGIAIGCCAYGLFGDHESSSSSQENDDAIMPPLWNETLSPYLGPMPTVNDMKDAIAWAAPWLDVETIRDEDTRNDMIVDELASGGVVAIYNGRSELGPRALGHRSILADPRKKGLVRFINEFVKKRESFRPFAPSCLAEEAGDWFDLGEFAASAANNNNVSPYMSITAQVKESKRDMIPAVTHVDGSSRLQTVTPESEPHYHKLISAFFKKTGVPMVLNTSFNTLKSEPIVETPRNALRSFLSSMGTIEMLVMGDYVIKRKDANIRTLLGEEQKNGMMTTMPSFPKRSGAVHYKTTFSVGDSGDDDDSSNNSKTLIQMPDRPMHNEKDGDDGCFELLDDLEGQLLGICDGSVSVNDIMTQFTAMAEEENYDKITEADQFLLENIIRRLVRLYEHTLISW